MKKENRVVQKDIAYESSTVRLDYYWSGEEDTLYVTFSSYDPRVGKVELGPVWADRICYSEASGLFFIAKENNWFNSSEIFECLEKATSIAANYKRVIAMGLSMGGYAAIYFSGMLGASSVVAFSPQASVLWKTLGVEDKRWENEWSKIKERYVESCFPINKECVIDIHYDPSEKLDKAHIRKIAEKFNVRLWSYPNNSHSVNQTLNEMGLFCDFFEVHKGNYIRALQTIQEKYRRGRKTNLIYWRRMLRRISTSNLERTSRLIDHIDKLLQYSVILTNDKRSLAELYYCQSLYYSLRGDFRAAIRVLSSAVDCNVPRMSFFCSKVVEYCFLEGDFALAEQIMRRAVELNSSDLSLVEILEDVLSKRASCVLT